MNTAAEYDSLSATYQLRRYHSLCVTFFMRLRFRFFRVVDSFVNNSKFCCKDSVWWSLISAGWQKSNVWHFGFAPDRLIILICGFWDIRILVACFYCRICLKRTVCLFRQLLDLSFGRLNLVSLPKSFGRDSNGGADCRPTTGHFRLTTHPEVSCKCVGFYVFSRYGPYTEGHKWQSIQVMNDHMEETR